ncbi:MAG: 30S ribosomal protein S6 [Sedimentisphaerales bacterium]|nr:30S ribosomal protein S6 [Sedimentisphaerales bacterium]
MAHSVKRLYEGMFIVDSAMATANWDDAYNAVKSILDRASAEILNIRKWDDRRLCYEIKGHRRGTYILSYFRADSSVITGMERDVQLSETIIRMLVLRADHISSDVAEAQEQMNAATPFDLHESEEAAAEAGDSDLPEKAAVATAVAEDDGDDSDMDADADISDDESELE